MGRYGMSFAKKLTEEGRYEEAIAEATREIDAGKGGPEIIAERAAAYELCERWSEAVDDFERAIVLDRDERVLELDLIDDAYFSALLAAAREDADKAIDVGVARLDRYAALLPSGNHVKDAIDWKKRLKGELVSTLDKTRDMDKSP
jgi:tetratricopeptide (TPR) repeat protein